MTPSALQDRAVDPIVRVRRWARRVLYATVVVVIAYVFRLALHAPLLGYAGLVRPIAVAGLVVALGALLDARGVRRAAAITRVGLTAVALELGSLAVSLWLPAVFGASLAIAAGWLAAGWLYAVGVLTGRFDALPPPLPRRARVGAVGQAILAIASPTAFPPFGLIASVVGIVLGLSTLGLLFGLADLDPRANHRQVSDPEFGLAEAEVS